MAAAGGAPPAAGARLSGSELLVQYRDYPNEWHARIILASVSLDPQHEEYIIYTPDGDLYEEDVGPGSENIVATRVRPLDRSIPYGIVGEQVYDFVALPSQGELAGLLHEGEAEAGRLQALRRLRVPPGGDLGGAAGSEQGGAPPQPEPLPRGGQIDGIGLQPGTVAAAAGLGAMLQPGAGPAGMGAGGAAYPGGAVLLQPGGAGVGQLGHPAPGHGALPIQNVHHGNLSFPLPHPGGQQLSGAFGIPGVQRLPGGGGTTPGELPPVPAQVDAGAPVAPAGGGGLAGLAAALQGTPSGGDQFSSQPAMSSGDVRIMSVRCDVVGERYREFSEAVHLLETVVLADSPVKGPNAILWVCRFIKEHGGTPSGWHSKWVSLMKLQPTDAGVHVHEIGCKTLEIMICFDQLQVGSLAAAEFCARQIQLVEEKYRDRGVPKDSLELVSEAALFSGSRSRTTICVCPALSEWIAEEMRKEAAVMKERRKAREERNLAKPPK